MVVTPDRHLITGNPLPTMQQENRFAVESRVAILWGLMFINIELFKSMDRVLLVTISSNINGLLILICHQS